ncbi:MAG: protein translocase subunit SecD [Alphaproteobacteria bacterium]|nr:protein translocase subunit SecD [Alphaproteobacteria bacterium]
MFHYSRWKIIGIVASVLISLLVASPNIMPASVKTYMADHMGLHPLTLGLDLQGGSDILMQVDHKDMTDKLDQQLTGDIRASLREAKIGYSGISKIDSGVTVRITKPEDLEKAKTELTKLIQPLTGGLFGSGTQVTLYKLSQSDQQFNFTIDSAGLDAKIAAAINQSLKIVESRINGSGTTEPVIQQQGKDRISVEVPGLQDPAKIKQLLGSTAKLTFQLLCAEQPTSAAQVPPPECKGLPQKADVDRLTEAKKAKGEKVTAEDLKTLPQTWVQTSGRATVDGGDLNDAQSAFGQDNSPVVTFKFNQKGALRFGKLTSENIDKPFAIILDDVIMSAPVIRSAILGGSGEISGRFTLDETNNLAIVLRSGALPAKLNIIEEQTVGPSLGADSIRAGLMASLVGLVAVMVFMLLPYGLFGVIADIAVIINLIMLIAVMSLFGFTLTLPGIAGIVLTLGMAVDSNVLIYERIREEWRNGRSAMGAIETGFKAAFATVFDANITTLIAAVVLFGVGSGPIRGFAVTLAVGIATTMFTAFLLTKFMVAMWVKWKRPKEINL